MRQIYKLPRFQEVPVCGIDGRPHAPKLRDSARHGTPSAPGERLLPIASQDERSFCSTFGDSAATQCAQLSAPPIDGARS